MWKNFENCKSQKDFTELNREIEETEGILLRTIEQFL